MTQGTHAQIVKVLEADADIQAALAAFKSGPSDTTRDKAIDTIVRYTGNCIGQAALQEAQGKGPGALSLTPKDASRSIYKALPTGEQPIFTAIDADASARDALHTGNDDTTVTLVSRMTGRCVGQSLFGLGIGLPAVLAKLELTL
jgi:hypothetical protein